MRPFARRSRRLKPEVVSFHFGLPEASLLKRVKAAGCLVMSSATTVAEARWLEERGCDVIIAQGYEAGGHRGMFLTEDLGDAGRHFRAGAASRGCREGAGDRHRRHLDARGIVAALALGASAVQIGSAYMHCPESKMLPPHRAALKSARDDGTVLTNLMTGRPARGFVNRVMRELGPINAIAPEFPLAGGALAPLRAKAQAQGSGDFSSMWAGQAAALGRDLPAREVTRKLAEEAQALMRGLAG